MSSPDEFDRYPDEQAPRPLDEIALYGFAAWVATHRAYNGSGHPYGQSLYNECLNGVLTDWVAAYLAESHTGLHPWHEGECPL